MKATWASLLIGICAPAAAAMTDQPLETAQYFPLIDGARYDYVYARGPHAAATSVMHANQTWGGVAHLISMHTTLTCRSETPCSQDAADFYRMDPDGVHYFGGDGDTPSDDHFMAIYASPEWILKNPVAPGTMMGSGMYQGADSWQAAISGMNSMMGEMSYMSSYQAEALETVTTPMGTFTNALHVREQRGSGYMRDVWYAPGVGVVRWMDANEEAVLARVTIPTGPVPAVARAVEYYHPALDHYFLTANADEIAALDGGHFAGWQRTGMSFNVIDPAADTSGASAVCRYYGLPAYGLDTHFYSAFPTECADVGQRSPGQWLLESNNAFRVHMPDMATGACPAGTQPLYRTWNRRADSNHRYTIDARVQTAMMGHGSVAEGFGDPPVAMCATQ